MAYTRRINSLGSSKSKLGVTASVRNRRIWTGNTAWNDTIISYDNNNLYPNLLEFYVKTSSYAMTAVNAFRSFLYGRAFEDINLNNQIFYKELGLILSGKQILKHVIDDYSIHNTFALHCKYNPLGELVSIKPIPVRNCRLGRPVDNEIKKIWYFDNWEMVYGNLLMSEPVGLPVFNPDNVLSEFEEVGGWGNHHGQIYMYKSGLGRYDFPIWDSVTDQIITDIEIQVFRRRLTQNNFTASAVLSLPYDADEKERMSIASQINNSQGSENAGNVTVLSGFNKDTMPELIKFDASNQDKLYTIIDESVKNAIRRVLNIPPVLVGDLVAGKLGGTAEIKENEALFEEGTLKYREDIEEALYDVISRFYIPYTNIKIKTKYGTIGTN